MKDTRTISINGSQAVVTFSYEPGQQTREINDPAEITIHEITMNADILDMFRTTRELEDRMKEEILKVL